MANRVRIAYIAGPNATIHGSPPLVTSNKARAKYGLPPFTNSDGSPARYDVLRPQRLARPATVYVEQFSAHPLEPDAAALYAPPDGYIDPQGQFHRDRQGPHDKPVFEIELRPEDGLYPMPYMARQADGGAWDHDGTEAVAPGARTRQSFYPDGVRPLEEIDRLAVGEHGLGNLISSRADVDFYRVLPSAGYTTAPPDGQPAETRGRDFFPYRPPHLAVHPPLSSLAEVANELQRIASSGRYDGVIWTQGSPRIEETLYWLNLLLDTTLPICGNAAHRSHGQISGDGPKTIVDSIDYIASRVWADEEGRDRLGAVLIHEQQIFAAREVQKGDARPGGYVTTGGHGGILGAVGHEGPPVLTYVPATQHTFRSAVSIARLASTVHGVRRDVGTGHLHQIDVHVKNAAGELLAGAIPRVSIVKDGNYTGDGGANIEEEVDLLALLDANLREAPLAGFVVEGLSPYGTEPSLSRHAALLRAVHSGMPVVRVGRGNNEGFTAPVDRFLGGRNLTATKARMLLMACLMRFGSPPPAADPEHPSASEIEAIRRALAAYQEIFDTH